MDVTEQKFQHRERRFLVPLNSEPDKKLLALDGGRTYEIVTQYLDTPERTWSALTMGDEHPKIRFRTYDAKDSFLEKKFHSENETRKERMPCEKIPAGLIRVGATIYKRTEYTIGKTRVTVDRDLISGEGERLEGFAIVEVKGRMPKTLSYLKTFEESRWSKWKFITGRLPKQIQTLLYAVSRDISSKRNRNVAGAARIQIPD